MAEKRRLISFDDLPPHLVSEMLISGSLSAIDLVNIELTSRVFGVKSQYSLEFKSLADQAASRLCYLHPIFMVLSQNHQNELFERCKRNWKRVLRFLQRIAESSETPKGKMQITTGPNLTMVIKDSKVYSCGSNEFGALVKGMKTRKCLGLTPIKFPFSVQVIQVSTSNYNTAFVTQSGEVFTCGRNAFFSCGHSQTSRRIYRPRLVQALNGIPCKQVATGLYSTVFLTREGHVYTVGGNKRGQLGHGDTMNRNVPTMVEVLERIVQVSAGPEYVLAVTEDGSVYSFGHGSYLCLGHGDFSSELKPRAIQGFKTKGVHIIRVCAGEGHAAAIDSNGYVYTWGHGYSGALGHGDQYNRHIPEIMFSLKNHLAVQVCATKKKTFVVVESGLVYGVGRSRHGSLGFPEGLYDKLLRPTALEHLKPHRVLQVSTGKHHTVVVTQEGRLFGFGDNRESQLGHHSIQSWLEPTEICLKP